MGLVEGFVVGGWREVVGGYYKGVGVYYEGVHDGEKTESEVGDRQHRIDDTPPPHLPLSPRHSHHSITVMQSIAQVQEWRI